MFILWYGMLFCLSLLSHSDYLQMCFTLNYNILHSFHPLKPMAGCCAVYGRVMTQSRFFYYWLFLFLFKSSPFLLYKPTVYHIISCKIYLVNNMHEIVCYSLCQMFFLCLINDTTTVGLSLCAVNFNIHDLFLLNNIGILKESLEIAIYE